MTGVSLKQEEEALFSGGRRGRPYRRQKSRPEGKPNQQRRPIKESKSSGGAHNRRSDNNQEEEDRNDQCYNCGKKGHYARDCWFKKKGQGNAVTTRNCEGAKSQEGYSTEEEWDVEVDFATTINEKEDQEEKQEIALTAVTKPGRIDYDSDWIIDSGCSNHMTGDIKKLEDLEQYKGRQVIVTANNSKLPITYIGNTRITPRFSPQHIQLERVYHVPGMKKNLFLVSQLTAQGNYVLFEPEEVKVYRNLKTSRTPIMEGRKLE